MFLHEDRELFKDVLAATSASQNDREIPYCKDLHLEPDKIYYMYEN